MNKPTLLCIPGLMCDEYLWHYQTQAFCDVANVIIADTTGAQTIERMAQNALQQTGGPLWICGLSMGGFVALEIYSQAPERVLGLGLFNTSARAESPKRKTMREDTINLMEQGAAFHNMNTDMAAGYLHTSRHTQLDLIANIAAMGIRLGPQCFIDQCQALIARRDYRDMLSTIACPTIVIGTKADMVTPAHLQEEICDHIDQAQLHMLPNCGHLSTLEQPDLVNEIIGKWMKRDPN